MMMGIIKMIKLFSICYDGAENSYGGRSYVLAPSEEEALDLVEKDYRTKNFTRPFIEEIPMDHPLIIFNNSCIS